MPAVDLRKSAVICRGYRSQRLLRQGRSPSPTKWSSALLFAVRQLTVAKWRCGSDSAAPTKNARDRCSPH